MWYVPSTSGCTPASVKDFFADRRTRYESTTLNTSVPAERCSVVTYTQAGYPYLSKIGQPIERFDAQPSSNVITVSALLICWDSSLWIASSREITGNPRFLR